MSNHSHQEQRRLINILNEKTKEYDENRPSISDKEWDDLFFQLQELEYKENFAFDDSPTQNISYTVVNKLEKVRHEHPMLSLPKTKDADDVSNFIGKKAYLMMTKLDGLTCSLTYENGMLTRAETRGNGEIGENILHNAKVIDSIPKEIEYKEKLVIDGEIICRYSDFEEFKDDYANPRNFAAGSIRLLNSKECKKRNLTFVAWDVIEGYDNVDDLYILLRNIEDLGFIIVPYIFDSFSTVKEELDEIKVISSIHSYPTDGVVIKYRSRKLRASLPSTAHHTGGALAFKFYDEEYETKLLDIEYEPSRNGELTPVAIFEEIDTGSSVVSKSSLHNLSIMKDILGENVSVGQKIWVCKKNEIIPQIVKAEPPLKFYPIPIPRKCPVCGEPTTVHMSDSGVKTLYCSNNKCSAKIVNQFEHFCGKNGLDIKGLSKKTLEKLIDWGWLNNYEDIFKLRFHRTEWQKKEGFGEKSVNNILQAIEDSLDCTLDQFLCAIGIPLIGKSASKILAKELYSWNNFMELINSGKCDFTTLDGFGVEMNSAIKNFDYSYMGIESLGYYISPVYIQEEKSNSNTDLNGITFCITGKLNNYKRDELKVLIQNMGGKVTDSVSKNTNFLITNTPESGTSKNKKAKELNISIITEEDFIKKYLT